MRSLFLRTFLLFWLTAVLAAIAMIFAVKGAQGPPPGLRESLFAQVLPASAADAAKIYETSGGSGLQRQFTELETKYPLQVFFYSRDGAELLGGAPPAHAGDMARLTFLTGLRVVVANLAGERSTGPSGQTYALIFYQEPGPRYRLQSREAFNRLVGVELPIVVLIASSLFCYFTARHVTRPVVGLRAAAAGIAEGRLSTRVDPAWTRRKDEIGELSRDFDRMAARIESLVAGQKRLLGDVSHELRSPLSRLVVALGLLRSQPVEEAPELIERLGLEARRLDTLIGQLLALARIDSGMHGGAERFDLASVVEEVARDAGFEARAAGRAVTVQVEAACMVNGSEELLRSAVENVVRNAVRHTGKGTQVGIALEKRGDLAMVTVRDHGPGVAEALLAEIFVPFRRAANNSGDGAGLGLAIAERAVQLHGGSIRAENAPGGGLMVTIQLPVTQR